jgi:cardiolipin synthase
MQRPSKILRRILRSPRNYVLRQRNLPKPISSPKIPENQAKVFQRLLASSPYSSSNRVAFYFSGDAAFDAMWNAISQAKISIRMDIYHFEGLTAEKTRQLLIQKAQEGVSIALTYDVYGSSMLLPSFRASLEEAGVTVIPFNDPLDFRNPFVRNHRKLLVIDDNIGFIGGMNFTDQFRSVASGGLGTFRDVQIRIQGSAARALGHLSTYSAEPTRRIGKYYVFSRYLPYFKARFSVAPPLPENEATTVSGNDFELSPLGVHIIDSDFLQRRRGCQFALKLLLQAAVSRCYLTSPYFIPTRKLRNQLLACAKRGVDVRIVTAGVNELGFALYSSQYIYRTFLNAGIRIYEYHGPLNNETLHSKLAMIDGYTGCVGSFNLDLHSDRNLEVMAVFYSPTVVAKLELEYEDYLLHSKEVTLDCLEKRSFWHNIRNKLCYHIVLFGNNFAGPSQTPVSPFVRWLRKKVVYLSKASEILRRIFFPQLNP